MLKNKEIFLVKEPQYDNPKTEIFLKNLEVDIKIEQNEKLRSIIFNYLKYEK